MKKVKKIIATKYKEEEIPNMINEPSAYYEITKKSTSPNEFSYKDFKKIADKIPFSCAEWAGILHVSERTLQRYAKSNSTFAPINGERISLIQKVLKEATITFGKPEIFYSWIIRNPYSLEGNLSVQSLSTFDGIQNILSELGRIQHGVFA